MASSLLVAVLGVGVCGDGPVVHADDLGFTRGDGCFEATRIEVHDRGTRIDQLDAHLARFARSASSLGIEVDEAAWRDLIAEAIAAWDVRGEAVLRWMLSRGRETGSPPTGILTIVPLDERTLRLRNGVTAVTLDRGHRAEAFVGTPWLLGGVKTLSYAVNVAAGREAARRGANDAIFVSSDGYVLEATRAAVVWRVGERLSTTPTDGTGVLASITCEAAFAAADHDGIGTSRELITVDELRRTDGVWLLSSGRLVAPVRRLDDAPLAVDDSWTTRLRGLVGR